MSIWRSDYFVDLTCQQRLHIGKWSAHFGKQGGRGGALLVIISVLCQCSTVCFMNLFNASSWLCQMELGNNESCLSYKDSYEVSPVKIYVATASSEEDTKGSDVAARLSTYVCSMYIMQSQSQSSSHADSRQWLPLTEVKRRSQGPILRSIVKV